MSDIIHIDYETFSECDIKLGAYRYASDPSTEILMAAVALNDGEPYIWTPEAYGQSDPEALEIMEMWEDPSIPVYAHNCTFEIAVSHYLMQKSLGVMTPEIEQWRCTMAMSLKAALPAALDKVAKELKLVQQKDDQGKKLIAKFSKPSMKRGQLVRTMPQDDPDAFAEFIEYCKQDVRTEREIHKKLSPFELKGQALRTFQFTNAMNLRGVPVNTHALEHAQNIIDDVSEDLTSKFTRLTGLTPTQNIKLKDLYKSHGYPYDSMDVEHTGKALSKRGWYDPKAVDTYRAKAKDKNFDSFYREIKEDHLIEALLIRRKVGFAAVKKVTSMLQCSCPDGYVRGSLQYYGAFRTGRWAGRLIQTQNFKRPIFKADDNAHIYEMVCEHRPKEEIEMLYTDSWESIASAIRHFIHPKEGRKLFDADYAGIEARIVCWLGNDQEALREFENGEDTYIKMCLKIFPDTTEKEQLEAKARDESTIERFVGKQAVLGCGFGMGAPKFQGTCEGYGQKLEMPLCERAVHAYRKKYRGVVNLWYACDRAARNAIAKPGVAFRAGKYLKFRVINVSGIAFLTMLLPSGRNLVYPHPKITNTGKFGDEISFLGPRDKAGWGRIGTFGGKLVENATQAVAADVMAVGATNAHDAGYEIITLIHDQALALSYPERGQTIEEFCNLLTKLPSWADGLPVVAEGKVTNYYVK